MNPRAIPWLIPVLILGGLAGCKGSNSAAPIGIAPDPVVGTNDPLPGVVVQITAVRGGSGPSGRFRVGDRPTIDFTLMQKNGQPLELSGMARGAIMVSGPTVDYQRVIASQSDLVASAKKTALGAYSYQFSAPIPAGYLAPLNDTAALSDGELTGQPLVSGTYTVGIELRKDYTVDGVVYRDPGNTTADFLFGDAQVLEPRDVVTLGNCNQCHTELRAHGNNRNNLTNCLLCHTAGAEDKNTASIAGGTPGVTIDFRVMIHKLHNGAHLPSVLGVASNTDGTRNYQATPKPYQLLGFGSDPVDFSDVEFPQWPSLFTPMPRDIGYAALVNTALPPTDPVRIEGVRRQGLENTIRSGVVACDKCHGDPDGAGPLPAPSGGDLIYAQPTRRACGSCHDDWDPELPYRSNSSTMPIQRDDAACKDCHRPSGTALDVRDAHTHPLVDPNFAHGVNFSIDAVADVGNGNGRFEALEKIAVTLDITDDNGAPIQASSLSRLEMALSGPTTNPNMVHLVRIAQAALTGDGPYTFNLPAPYYLEPIGTSTGALNNFGTLNAPHWNASGATTSLLRRTADGATATLTALAPALQNYLDVNTGAGASFNGQPYVVIEDADSGRREFMRVQWVEGDRLWFGSEYRADFPPRILKTHPAGAEVKVVTVAAVPTTSYTLNATNGAIAETTEFGAGEILCTYTSDFVVPDDFPGALNESPTLGEDWGDWTGLPLVSGTYKLGAWGARSLTFTVAAPAPALPETTGYTEGGTAATALLKFGTATTITDVRRIDGPETCNACHADIQFHGGSRRGVDTCLMCHGNAGTEDAANYTYPTADATPGVTADFRTMLHKIHHGKELAEGADYVVVGNGGTGHTYEHVGFPSFPGGTLSCATCHGEGNTAWQEPAARLHPAQTRPTRAWNAVCGSCHDSVAQHAHIDANTAPSGAEACAICHGPGEEHDVAKVHTVR